MEAIANRIVDYLDADKKTWDELDRMRMALGLQILIHNIFMVGTILLLAKLAGMFSEATILLSAFGALKMTAGGVHFKKSSACLLGTGIFVVGGIMISRQLDISLIQTVVIYVFCLVVLVIIGPQGTENNPISKENYEKLRRRTVVIVLAYLILTVILAKQMNYIPYLLLVAVTFETMTLLPSYIKNRSR